MASTARLQGSPRAAEPRDLRLFLAARVVAVAGSAVTGVAMPLLVYRMSGSALQAALVPASGVAPYLVWGLLAGALADRLPRRRIMVASQLVSAVALLSVVIAEVVGGLTVAHAIAVMLVVATGFVWFDAAAFGALPAIVGRDRVVEANSRIWSMTTLVGVGGPALGGLLVVAVGPAIVLLVDVAAYLVAAALLMAISSPMGPPTPARVETGRSLPVQIGADVLEGVRFIRSHRVVRLLTLVGIGNSVAGGAVTALLVVIAAQRYDGVAGGATYGVLVTASAGGAFLASVALPRLDLRLGVGKLAIAGLLTGIPVAALLAVPLPVAAAIALTLVWSGANTVTVLNGITARQRVTPGRLQARVNTTARMVAWGGTPFGAVLAGAVADQVGLTAALALAAGVLAGTVGLALVARVHRLQVEPVQP